jgi:hypothetical protein
MYHDLLSACMALWFTHSPITAQRVLVALEPGDGRPRCRTVTDRCKQF